MALVLAVLLLPIAEIAGFILVGGAIGLWPTLLLVVLSAVAGMAVLRSRALLTLPQFQEAIAAGGDPMAPIAHGALVMLAGALLLVPGFLTDILGLLLLVPAVRRLVLRWASSRVSVSMTTTGMPPRQRNRGPAIEAEYEVVQDDVPPSQRGHSGWTRPD